jgi:multiple antibiotic resistance protein
MLSDFILLFTIIDPIGSVPVFIAVASRAPAELRTKIAFRAILISAGALLFFLALGRPLLNAISIDLSAFRVAGGIILFLFAIDMIFGQSKPEREVGEVDRETALDMAVYPMAIPSIAGPGAILAIIVLSDTAAPGLVPQLTLASMLLAVLAIVFVAMLAANRIQKLIGVIGASIVSRIMGLIVAAIAAQSVLAGVRTFFEIGTTP